MTGHRAASPVASEVGSQADDGLLPASRPERLSQASGLLSAPPLVGDGQVPSAQSAATRTLGPEPESVRVGRDFTRDTLAGWGMTALSDIAELVVSELVTNALRHGLRSADAADDEHSVRLRLLAQSPYVMCMVSDPGTEIPVQAASDLAAVSGRGLQVVDACSVRWGWHLLDNGGKVVWALLR